MLRWMALAIILARGLLSNVVMFDANAPSGSFGLVICSGYGPMFATTSAQPQATTDGLAHAQPGGHMSVMAMPGMNMPMPSSASSASSDGTNANSHASDDGHGSMNMDDSMQGGSAICPFSAALFAAVFTVIVFLLLATDTVRRVRVRRRRTIRVVTTTPYRLPPSRAPPLAPAC